MLMPVILKIAAALLAYLIGSIATSVWVGKIFYGIDIREHGSGNAGATNTFRVLGKKAGIPVLIIDILKGFAAVSLIRLTDYYVPGTSAYYNSALFLGAMAILGHIFPVYVGFRGGKGVATLFGVVLAVHPPAALLTVAIFLTMLFVSKYVSLSSMVAGLSFPFLLLVIFKTTSTTLVIFGIVVSVLLLFTHQQNIERLIKREESKANIRLRRRRRQTMDIDLDLD